MIAFGKRVNDISEVEGVIKMRRKKRIMVCVTQQKSCERLIKKGADLCRSEHDELYVVHVVKENWKYFGKLHEADALEYLFDISKTYGAFLSVIKAADIETSLAKFITDHKIEEVVMGESFEPTAQQNMINRLTENTMEDIRVTIVPVDVNIQELEPAYQ